MIKSGEYPYTYTLRPVDYLDEIKKFIANSSNPTFMEYPEQISYLLDEWRKVIERFEENLKTGKYESADPSISTGFFPLPLASITTKSYGAYIDLHGDAQRAIRLLSAIYGYQGQLDSFLPEDGSSHNDLVLTHPLNYSIVTLYNGGERWQLSVCRPVMSKMDALVPPLQLAYVRIPKTGYISRLA